MDASRLIFHRASDEAYGQILQEAADYALLSFPFTINRMGIASTYSRLRNIVKGKIAEGLFKDYGRCVGKAFDFKSGETPFWKRDLYDFLWDGMAYDLKNNFIHADELLEPEVYLDLPALVPHRHDKDQWAQRGLTSHGEKAFCFTFISDGGAKSQGQLFKLIVSNQTIAFLEAWCSRFPESNPEQAPYDAEFFWSELTRVGKRPTTIPLKSPTLVITAEARPAEFDRFEDTDSHGAWGYAMYKEHWYKVRERGGLDFCDGLIQTRIRNATCPIKALPAFRG